MTTDYGEDRPEGQEPEAGGDHSEGRAAELDRSIGGRRRFLKQAAGTSAVLVSLSSRPVFGNQCTVSGMYSGNISPVPGETCEGCTPGYWKVLQHKDEWAATGYSYCNKFHEVFGFFPPVTGDPAVDDGSLTLLQALCLQGGGAVGGCNWKALARHLVAGLLNACHPYVNYGYDCQTYMSVVAERLNNGECESLKNDLEMLNERWCPLGGQGGPGSGSACKLDERLQLDEECHFDCGTPLYTEADYQ